MGRTAVPAVGGAILTKSASTVFASETTAPMTALVAGGIAWLATGLIVRRTAALRASGRSLFLNYLSAGLGSIPVTAEALATATQANVNAGVASLFATLTLFEFAIDERRRQRARHS